MLGRIYAFERSHQTDASPVVELVSPRALRAVTLAMNGEPGIRFEELTEFDNPHPMIVVLFQDRQSIRRFDERLQRLLDRTGITVTVMGTSLGLPQASGPGLDETRCAA